MTAAPPGRLARALRVGAACVLSLAALSGMSFWTHQPWVFPSLGPTAFLAFAAPGAPGNHPRRALLGHAIGLGAGYGALALCGLDRAGPVTATGVDLRRVAAAALALGVTGAGMVLADAEHAPAGATTLIVALGFLTAPHDLAICMLAVTALVVLSIGLRRALRLGA